MQIFPSAQPRRALFIRALPGAGKTTLVAMRPLDFIDSDVVARIFDVKSAQTFEPRMQSAEFRAEFLADLEREAGDRYILTNFEPTRLAVSEAQVVARYAYRPDTYVAHLRLANRLDLLDPAKPWESRLSEWARAYEMYPKVRYLEPGHYLADAIV